MQWPFVLGRSIATTYQSAETDISKQQGDSGHSPRLQEQV